jgi:transcriptional regulator GlxA family with amidase domain
VDLAILLFDNVTALDAIGPYEVLQRVPGMTVRFVAPEQGVKRTENGSLQMVADTPLEDVRAPDVLLVPGGVGELAMRDDPRVLEWLRTAHETTRYTTSVCTGSLVLAAAGLLRGVRATTHWTAMEHLGELGAVPVAERVVESGKVLTAAGVSSGIDMALVLAARLAGDDVAQAIQLSIEYDPEPPFRAGSPSTAPDHVVERQRAGSRFARLTAPPAT